MTLSSRNFYSNNHTELFILTTLIMNNLVIDLDVEKGL